MFPNKSSSYEISSKTNAFVQNNNEEGKSEGLRGLAHPLELTSPTQQVPEVRDVMVVDLGVSEGGDPVLTVIANHPSPAPANSSHTPTNGDCESDGSSKMPLAETRTTGALCLDSIKSFRINDNVSFKDNLIASYRMESSTLMSYIPQSDNDADQEVESFKVCDYYTRWGIPQCLKLKGGGESSLTTGTTGWGSPPSQSGGSGWSSSGGGSGGGGGQSSGNGGGGGATGTGGSGQGWSTSSGTTSQGNNNNTNGGNNNNNNSNGNRGQDRPAGGSGASGGNAPQGSAAGQGQPGASGGQSGSNPSSAPNNLPPNNAGTGSGSSGGTAPGSGQQGSAANNQQGGSTWAAAAGKGLPPAQQGGQQGQQPGSGAPPGGSNTSPSTPGSSSAVVPAANSSGTPGSGSSSGSTTKQQMEQLNTMREALYSQDGWGGQNVNQDSNWDIPGSPEPGGKDGSTSAPVPLWKLPINNGTELWEANLRNGGLPPPASQSSQKAPWGHTPSSNIGGHWGEDDEGDSSNMWTGVPPAPVASGPQWPTQPPPIWPGKKEGEWNGPNWSEGRGDLRGDLRHSDMRQMMEARDHIRPTGIDHRSMAGNEMVMRGGDPRGSGRLNGVTGDGGMWGGGPGPHHHLPHHPPSKLPVQPQQPPVSGWSGSTGSGGGGGMKEMPGGLGVGGKSGWEEPSPPAQRRNLPNYDDGTSLWGAAQHPRPQLPGQNKVSHWKEMPSAGMGRGGLQCPPGRANPGVKPDIPLWPHHPRNGGGWAESGMEGAGGGWEDKGPGGGPWMDGIGGPSVWPSGPKHKPWTGVSDGSDLDPPSWVNSKQPPQSKAHSKEYIWTSKQFRILSDMGFKKDDIEAALRNSGMVLEDALEQLNTNRALGGGGGGGRDPWPPHRDLEQDHVALMNTFPSPATPQQTICTFPYPGSSRSQQAQQPSAQQLRMLVQQIQMAVQGGYLSPQILNQPLAPQTLLLLNQLLQQIKHLQTFMQHHSLVQMNPLKPNSSQILQLSVQITKTKQQISNLQNQIAAQQALYVKQQHQTPPSSDFLINKPIHEPITTLHNNFSELSFKDTQSGVGGGGGGSQQSRLTQWKLPSLPLDKESDMTSGEFSRAPGTTAKSGGGSSSPNTNLLLGQPDGTWSNRDSGWPDSSTDDSGSKDWPNSSQPSQAFSDLVPEFEPGKPWKGNPLPKIEDDPTLTPGSVARSPLSLPNLKDTHILSGGSGGSGGKASPTTSSLDIMPLGGLSSSSTWSFNPPPSSTNSSVKLSSSVSSGSTNGGNKSSSAGWESNSSELWGGGGGPGKRPPPGLSGKPGSSGGPANGWVTPLGSGPSGAGGPGARWPGPSPSQQWPGSHSTQPGGSSWLLLRNLTPQIDGSTLKTLCVQHGPLLNFHLYLNHGIALAKYSSREEASKAQGALNNCVLSNTTIFAESPGESDIMTLLSHLSSGGAGGSGGGSSWRGKDSWSSTQLWGSTPSSASASAASSLWTDSSDQHRNTPSSINSFLPPDLLGNESI